MENNLYTNYEKKDQIIDMQLFNEKNDKNDKNNNNKDECVTKFFMQERNPIKSFIDEHSDPMTDILNKSLLYKTYFSIENIKIIQNGIRAGVYKISKDKYVFPVESTCINLQRIMKSVIQRFGDYTKKEVTIEITMMNEKVLDYCIDFIYKAAVSYEIFLNDQLRLVVPLEHSLQVDRDYKQLQYKI